MQNTQFSDMGGGQTFGEKARGTGQKCVYYLYKEVTMEESDFEEEGQLTDKERLELEQLMLAAAYENSYRVLTNKIEFEDLVEEKTGIGISAIMAYDPLSGIQKHELEGMIEYYVDQDESEYYLRCAELKKILDEIN